MERSGFVEQFLESGTKTDPDGSALIQSTSPELATQHDRLQAELRGLQVERQLAQTREPAKAQIVVEKIDALLEQIQRNRQDLAALDTKRYRPFGQHLRTHCPQLSHLCQRNGG